MEDDLAAGRLIELLGAYTRESSDMFLIYPDRRNLATRVRTFIDYLVDELAG